MITAKGVASILGGWFFATRFEQSGSWAMAFYTSAFMALVAAGLALGLRMAKAPAEIVVPVTAPAK